MCQKTRVIVGTKKQAVKIMRWHDVTKRFQGSHAPTLYFLNKVLQKAECYPANKITKMFHILLFTVISW